jgi:hypothetical protein
MKKLSLRSLLFLQEGQVHGVADFPLEECRVLTSEMAEMFDISVEDVRIDPLQVFVDEEKISFNGELWRPNTSNTQQNYTFRIDFYPTLTDLFIDNEEIAVGNPNLNSPLPIPEPENEEEENIILPFTEIFRKGVVEDRAILLYSEFIYDNYLTAFMTSFFNGIYSTTFQQNSILAEIIYKNHLSANFSIGKERNFSNQIFIKNNHTNSVLEFSVKGGPTSLYLIFTKISDRMGRKIHIKFPSEHFFELQLMAFQAGENEELLGKVADFIYEKTRREIEQKIHSF